MSDLSNCTICGGKVDWCTACDGCHLIVCSNCKASFDLSESVPNDADTLEELRQQIAEVWNARAPIINWTAKVYRRAIEIMSEQNPDYANRAVATAAREIMGAKQ